jgi:hypothetical protein
MTESRFLVTESCVSLMEQQIVVTHRYRVLQETEETLTDEHLSTSCCYENDVRRSNFFVVPRFLQRVSL